MEDILEAQDLPTRKNYKLISPYETTNVIISLLPIRK
jgi:hypothetical protein